MLAGLPSCGGNCNAIRLRRMGQESVASDASRMGSALLHTTRSAELSMTNPYHPAARLRVCLLDTALTRPVRYFAFLRVPASRRGAERRGSVCPI